MQVTSTRPIKAESRKRLSSNFSQRKPRPAPREPDSNMAATVELKRHLRWADADPAGRPHFPRIFEIVEEAESELLRGLDWPMDVRRRNYDFPRVHVESRFRRMLALDAPFRLQLSVGKLGRTSIRYDYQVFDADDELAIE